MKFFTLPNLLSELRILLVPFMLLLAWTNSPKLFLACLILALFTDMADGFLARKLRQTSELGAKLDSWADFATYPTLPLCAWWLRPDVIREETYFLVAGISFYIASIVFGFLKFRRLNPYHTWGGKVAAILLGAAALVIFAGGPGWPLRIVMPVVVLSGLEEMAITAMLSVCRADVPSLWHALQIRKEAGREKVSSVTPRGIETTDGHG